MYQRKDGRWVEVFTERGKRKYIYAATKKELIKKLKNYDEEKSIGKLFCDVVADWKEDHYPNLVPSTRKGYEASRKRALEQFGSRRINDIRPSEINLFLKRLANQGYGKKVVITQLNVLRMVCDYAICNEWLVYNPCSSVKIPSGLKQEKRSIPTEMEVQVVKSSDWLLPFFLLYTGCRRGEALAVTYEDIDFKNKTILINKAVGFENNRPFIKSPKTKTGVRQIPLLSPLENRLDKNGKGLLFPYNGGLYIETAITNRWKQWQQQYGVSVTMHQLRHMYATILYDAKVEEKDAQSLLGHSTIAMTKDVYTHIRESRRQHVADKLNLFVSSPDWDSV